MVEKMIPPEVEKTKDTLTIVFGRFNPPTIGHGKLLDAAKRESIDNDYLIFPSRTQNKKNNPLAPEIKISFMKKMFPNHESKIINNAEIKTIFDALVQSHVDGYTNIKIVVGSDRVDEFKKITENYNGKLYDFDNLEVCSAGERDPDGEGLEGMSASKQRQAAIENKFDDFMKGVPNSMDQESVLELFNTVRLNLS